MAAQQALDVLATGALRQTIEAAHQVASQSIGTAAADAAGLKPFPEIFVILYGVLFTALLASIYLHVFNELDRRARAIVEGDAPLPDASLASAELFSSAHKLRTELGEELELGGGIRKNLGSLLVIVSPLLSALLSRLAGVSI